MRNSLLFFIFSSNVNIILLIIKLKYESKTFLDFINDSSIKNDNNEKTKIIDIKDNINNSVLLKENEEYKKNK